MATNPFDVGRKAAKPPTTMEELIASKQPTRGASTAGTPANQSDFLGEGTLADELLRPKERATTPDGLVYLDTGEKTPLYYNRTNDRRDGSYDGNVAGQSYTDNTFRPEYVPGQDRVQAPGTQYKFDPKSGTYYYETGSDGGGFLSPEGDTRRRTYITNDPARSQAVRETPMFAANYGPGASADYSNAITNGGYGALAGGKIAGPAGAIVGAGIGATTGLPSASGRPIYATAIDPAEAPPGQRIGTPAEAAQANANFAATGNSNVSAGGASGGGSAGPSPNFSAQAAAERAAFDDMARFRGGQAQNMYATGQAAQGRAGASTGYIDYGKPQTVSSTQAANVNYGPAQSVSSTQAANVNYGPSQRVNAAQVGPAAQAVAQQANAENARNIADLDFAMANESRTAMGDSLNRIRAYVDQGPGESMAQAQLRMAQEQNLGDALSLARSGRGNAAGNMKMAISENAATNAQTNMQAALLRAQEADTWRGRQLQGLGLEQTGTTAMRTQDITAAQAQGQHAVSREQIASNVDVANAQLGTQVSLGNAEQQNLGTRLQAQLTTDAAGKQAELANALAIAQGNSSTQIGTTNATNATNASMTQAELANALAVAQGNSSTDINKANLEAEVRQREANDRLQSEMYGYGVDLGSQELNAQNYGADTGARYAELAADIYGRDADRAAKVKTENDARKDKKDAANKAAIAALIEELF